MQIFKQYMKVVIPRTVCREKIYFFLVPEVSFGDMTKPFEMSYKLQPLHAFEVTKSIASFETI